MKSQIVEVGSKKVLGYPKLMQGTESNVIVFFTEKRKGIIVNGNREEDELGWYYENWNMDFFQDFNGTIKLSNE